MAAPTSGTPTEVLATAAGSSTPIDSNLASRQMVSIMNNGTQPVTIVVSSGAGATPTAGKGVVIQAGDLEWFWAGPGLRFYQRVGPVPPGETAIDQVTGAGLWLHEMA